MEEKEEAEEAGRVQRGRKKWGGKGGRGERRRGRRRWGEEKGVGMEEVEREEGLKPKCY